MMMMMIHSISSAPFICENHIQRRLAPQIVIINFTLISVLYIISLLRYLRLNLGFIFFFFKALFNNVSTLKKWSELLRHFATRWTPTHPHPYVPVMSIMCIFGTFTCLETFPYSLSPSLDYSIWNNNIVQWDHPVAKWWRSLWTSEILYSLSCFYIWKHSNCICSRYRIIIMYVLFVMFSFDLIKCLTPPPPPKKKKS